MHLSVEDYYIELIIMAIDNQSWPARVPLWKVDPTIIYIYIF